MPSVMIASTAARIAKNIKRVNKNQATRGNDDPSFFAYFLGDRKKRRFANLQVSSRQCKSEGKDSAA